MNVLNKQMLLHKNLICSKKNNKIINLQNVINIFAKKVLKIVLRRLFSYRQTHKNQTPFSIGKLGISIKKNTLNTRFITFLIHHNIKTKVKIVTKKKIFDLNPGKLYFINK
jgi:SUMO ligase MMS21 Smc5/6 complex component